MVRYCRIFVFLYPSHQTVCPFLSTSQFLHKERLPTTSAMSGDKVDADELYESLVEWNDRLLEKAVS